MSEFSNLFALTVAYVFSLAMIFSFYPSGLRWLFVFGETCIFIYASRSIAKDYQKKEEDL